MTENKVEGMPVISKVEILNRSPVAVGIILDPLERILLQKKDGGYLWLPNKWAFPGGVIEEGEDPKKHTLERLKKNWE
jgi:8-oxo-dGTP pyrophosphatase MutT (NUDIX family)